MILGLCEQCDQFENDEIVDVKRYGRKTQGENRPVVVTFKEGKSKARHMTSLYNLRDADAPYNNIRVQHDLTPAEREQEKKLVQEATELTLNEQDFFLRGEGGSNRRERRGQIKNNYKPVNTVNIVNSINMESTTGQNETVNKSRVNNKKGEKIREYVKIETKFAWSK